MGITIQGCLGSSFISQRIRLVGVRALGSNVGERAVQVLGCPEKVPREYVIPEES